MSIEVIHDDHNGFCFWEMNIHKVSQAIGKVNSLALICDFNMSPRFQRSEHHKQVAGAIPFVLIVMLGG
jgi:hypothetical protein